MKRYIVTKPAWRARAPRQHPKARFNVTVSKRLHDAIECKATDEGCSMRRVADALIGRALDEAGAP